MKPETLSSQRKIKRIEAQPGDTFIITFPVVDQLSGKKKEVQMEVTNAEANSFVEIGWLVRRYTDSHLKYVGVPNDQLIELEDEFEPPTRSLYNSTQTRNIEPDTVLSNVRTMVDRVILDGSPNGDISKGLREAVLGNTDTILRNLFTQFDAEKGIYPEDRLITE